MVAIETGLEAPDPSASASSSGAPLGCLPGAERCDCRAVGEACDPGLECASGLCVLLGASPPPGSPLVPGAVTAASPGASSAPGQLQPGEPIPELMPSAEASAVAPEPTMPAFVAAPKGVNLIVNGDFASGDTYWRVDDGGGTAVAPAITSGALCVTVSVTQPFVAIAWPFDVTMGMALERGSVYQLTYDAWTDNPEGVIFEAKIGTATEPFTEHFVVDVSLTNTSEAYSHAFNSRSSAISGVLFEVNQLSSGAQVCVDNVSLKGL